MKATVVGAPREVAGASRSAVRRWSSRLAFPVAVMNPLQRRAAIYSSEREGERGGVPGERARSATVPQR